MTRPREAIVVDVQRFSLHDGPGIRTVVFFKGCTLACAWCQNPEAMRPRPELAYYAERCLEGCTLCTEVCPRDALRAERAERVDFERCAATGACVAACPTGALRLIGRSVTPESLLAELLRDRPFYETSGGGITLSGGEPVLQSAFLGELLPQAKSEGLHVVLETGGAYPFVLLEPLLPHLDRVLFDVKVADAARHERFTGRPNDEVLANLAELVRCGIPLEVRMPVVPGWNTDSENVAGTARRLSELGVSSLTLLPYNHLWEAKLTRIGSVREPLGVRPPPEGFYRELSEAFARHGLDAGM